MATELHLPTDNQPEILRIMVCGARSGQRAIELAMPSVVRPQDNSQHQMHWGLPPALIFEKTGFPYIVATAC